MELWSLRQLGETDCVDQVLLIHAREGRYLDLAVSPWLKTGPWLSVLCMLRANHVLLQKRVRNWGNKGGG